MRHLLRAFAAWVVVAAMTICPALAANDPPSATADAAETTTNHLTGLPMNIKLTFVLWVTLAIIGFGLVVLAAIIALFWRSIGRKTEEFVRIYAISLVVIASLVLIVAGYADSQIAPAFGLFGSIIGYIFGRGDSSKPPPPTDAPANGAKIEAG